MLDSKLFTAHSHVSEMRALLAAVSCVTLVGAIGAGASHAQSVAAPAGQQAEANGIQTLIEAEDGFFEASAPANSAQAASASTAEPLSPKERLTQSLQALPIESLNNEAERLLQLGAFARATAVLDEALKRPEAPTQPWLFYAQALAQSGQGKTEAALQTLQRLPQTAGDALQSAATLVEAKLILNSAEEALLAGNGALAETRLQQFRALPQVAELAGNMAVQNRFQRLFLAAGKRVPPPGDDAPFVRVGVMLPLTGAAATVGQDVLKAIQLALYAPARATVSADWSGKILLYPQDTAGTPQGANAAAQRLLQLGVDVVIGPLTADAVEAAAPLLTQANVPLLVLSSDAKIAAPMVHTLGYTPGQQVQAAVWQAYAEGRESFAALVPSNGYGYETFDRFKETLEEAALPLVGQAFYNPQAADIRDTLKPLLNMAEAQRKLNAERAALDAEFERLGATMDDAKLARREELKNAKASADVRFEALFLPTDPVNAHLVASQLAFYDVDQANVMLLGTALWQNPAILKDRAEFIRGARFAAPPEAAGFASAFEAEFGAKPHPLAVLGFDALHIVKDVAAERARLGEPFSQLLLREEGFAGDGGALRFVPDGATQRGYAVRGVTASALPVLQAAPEVMPPALPEALRPAEGGFLQRGWPFGGGEAAPAQPTEDEPRRRGWWW